VKQFVKGKKMRHGKLALEHFEIFLPTAVYDSRLLEAEDMATLSSKIWGWCKKM